MTELMRRRRALMGVASQGGGGLPAEYQQVEWIGTDGNPYIDPEITLTNGDVRMRMRAYVADFGSYGRFLCGQGSGSTMSAWGAALFAGTSGKIYIRSGSVTNGLDVAISRNTYFTVDASLSAGESQNATWGILIDYNGATYSGNGTMQTIGYAGKKWYVARPGTGGFGLFGRICSAECWNNGVKVFDGVPCYRKNDNVIGMYNLVDGVFYTNAGTSSFTKGADV